MKLDEFTNLPKDPHEGLPLGDPPFQWVTGKDLEYILDSFESSVHKPC